MPQPLSDPDTLGDADDDTDPDALPHTLNVELALTDPHALVCGDVDAHCDGDTVADTLPDTDADTLADRETLSVGEEDCEDASDEDGAALAVSAFVVGSADEVTVCDAEPLVE